MCTPSSLPSVVLLGLAYLRLAAAAPSLTDDSKCGCYFTNGTITEYFTKHKFYDFRSLEQYAGVPDVITDVDASINASPTSKYFTDTDWTDTWQIQTWNNSGDSARSDATVFMANSANNIYIEKNADAAANPSTPKTWLTLRTQRISDTFQTAAQFDSNPTSPFQYISIRMLARTIGAPGAVTAFFTYRDDHAGNVQEADLEIVTKDPRNVVQYTNQPSLNGTGDVIPEATLNATLPNGMDWTEWAIHRLDWTPTQSTWYVDGQQTANISFQVPRDAAQVILNTWSDGGQWTGNMSVHDAAYFQIQWLEMVYNTTNEPITKRGLLGGRAEEAQGGCKAVCSVDETPETGRPVMLFDNAAIRGSGGDLGLARWVSGLVVLGMAYITIV